jgi:hypothetical protein
MDIIPFVGVGVWVTGAAAVGSLHASTVAEEAADCVNSDVCGRDVIPMAVSGRRARECQKLRAGAGERV